jgi:molybdate transport system substrate-binding protein
MTVRAEIAVALLVVLIGACSASAGGSSPVEPVPLTIYGAASLRDVLSAIETAYEAAVPGMSLTIATDSSSTLRTQIEEGAPADIFLSADRKQADALVDTGLADGDAVDIAASQLTIVVPADNPAGITSPADLARPGVKVVAAGVEVPITSYAMQAIANLAAEPDYPAGFADLYAANVVSREENVQAVLAKIELGEGDAAIVYVTDAMSSSGVATIGFPARANVSASYTGVVLGSSTRLAEAHGFLDWLVGPAGREMLATFGFLPAT